jgi:hypothetical protein
MSEFAFYSFCGSFESAEERNGRQLTFQEWLDRWHSELKILVFEHPTRDYRRIPEDTLDAVSSEIIRLAL